MPKAKTAQNVRNTENREIPLNKLVEWPNNPRKTRNPEDQAQFQVNLRTQGQIVEFVVIPVPGKDLFYTIDGESRRLSMNANVDDGFSEADMNVKCLVLLDDLSEAQLLGIALASNTLRHNMNPIDEMNAYRDMARSGMKSRTIADIFGLSIRQVEQRISLGDLVPSAQELVRTGKRKIGWAEAMTIASPEEQERIVNEIAANSHAYPDAQSVRSEITRDAIDASMALFDPSELKSTMVKDLFSDENGGHFTDLDAFWEKQLEAVRNKAAELGETHKDVRIYDRQHFRDIEWAKGTDASEATAVIVTFDSGEVVVHECMIPPLHETMEGETENGEGAFLDGAIENFGDLDELEDGVANERVTVNPLDKANKETIQYLEGQIRAELRVRVASDPKLAQIFVIAATLTRSGKIASPMAVEGVGVSAHEQYSPAFQQMETLRTRRDEILAKAGIHAMKSVATVVETLNTLPDEVIAELFGYTVSESIMVPMTEMTFEVMDAIGHQALSNWKIDETYLSTLSQSQIRALAVEIVDIADQPSAKASKTVVRKAILTAVDFSEDQGNWIGKTGWRPPQIQQLETTVSDYKAAVESKAAQDAADAADLEEAGNKTVAKNAA